MTTPTTFRDAVRLAVDRLFRPDGFTTRELAKFVDRQPGRESTRKHSAAVMQELHSLAVLGIVRRGEGSPIVWHKASPPPKP